MAVGCVLLTAQHTTKDQKAAEAMAAAIKALGGEENIDGIRSLILSGTLKSNSLVKKIEIKMLLPDNFLWIEERGTVGTKIIDYYGISKGEYRSAGFAGNFKRMMPPVDYRDEFNRFSCLMMGMLLKSDVPLTIASMTDSSNRFRVAKATGEQWEIELDSMEKYPNLISYEDAVILPMKMFQDPVTKMSVVGHGDTVVVNAVTRFKDRVAIDGVMFPKTIVFESRDITEVQLEKIQINPKLTLDDFEIPQQP